MRKDHEFACRHGTQPLARQPNASRAISLATRPAAASMSMCRRAMTDGTCRSWSISSAITAGGPAHTNWKNYGENLPERLDRLIGDRRDAAGRRRLPRLLHPAWRQPVHRQRGHGPLGDLPASGRCCRLSRSASAAAAPAGAACSARARAGSAPWCTRCATAAPSGRRRPAIPAIWASSLYHLRDFADGAAPPRRPRHVDRGFPAQLRGRPEGEGQGLARLDAAGPVRQLRSGSDAVPRHPAAGRSAHLRGHRGALGELAALGSAAHGRQDRSAWRSCAS